VVRRRALVEVQLAMDVLRRPCDVDIDIEIRVDLRAAGRSDRLPDTVDYVRCYHTVREIVETGAHNLLEAVAEEIAGALLSDGRVDSVRVRVAKQPPIAGVFRSFAVVIERDRPGTPA